MTKRHNGRQQLVCGNVETIRTAYRLLEQLEAVWRGRVDRMGEILAGQRVGKHIGATS